jgi:phosphohistidine phosphatase SixA
MTVYLARHSKAVLSHPSGDAFRPLSEEGRQRALDLARLCTTRGMDPDLIVSSPYARALATAEIFSQKPGMTPRASSFLLPESSFTAVYEELLSWEAEGFQRIALFTHNPFVSGFCAFLTESNPYRDFTFHTPTVACLEFSGSPTPGKGHLSWILGPFDSP